MRAQGASDAGGRGAGARDSGAALGRGAARACARRRPHARHKPRCSYVSPYLTPLRLRLYDPFTQSDGLKCRFNFIV